MTDGVLSDETQDKNAPKKSPYFMESAQLDELYGLAGLSLIALPNDTIKYLVNVIRDRDEQIAELQERLQIIENDNTDLRKLYRQEVEQNTIMREALEGIREILSQDNLSNYMMVTSIRGKIRDTYSKLQTTSREQTEDNT